MANLDRIRVTLSGFAGGPGVITMYAGQGPAQVARIRDWLVAVASRVPTTVDMGVGNSGDTIEDTTGNLVGTWSVAAVANVAGTAAGAYSAPVGAVFSWRTLDVLNNRRLRGRSFLVPLTGAAFDTDGTITVAALSQFQTAGTALVTASAGNMRIWSRPFAGTPATATKPARDPHVGGSGEVTSCIVPDLAAVLRSRRD